MKHKVNFSGGMVGPNPQISFVIITGGITWGGGGGGNCLIVFIYDIKCVTFR